MQSPQPVEAVVSDDSDSSPFAAVRDACNGFNFHYVVGQRPGLYSNRDDAALNSSGTHTPTMDDDEFACAYIAACLRGRTSRARNCLDHRGVCPSDNLRRHGHLAGSMSAWISSAGAIFRKPEGETTVGLVHSIF